MRFVLVVLLFSVFVTGCAGPKVSFGSSRVVSLDPAAPFDHGLLDGALSAAVDPVDGRVDYEVLRGLGLEDLDAYLAMAGEARVDRWSVGDQKTFWINVHNAAVLRLIASEWPLEDLGATRRLLRGDLLDRRLWLAGRWRSPRDVRGHLLERFGDPRVFFVLSEGTVDDPPLGSRAYEVETLDIQLNVAADEFLHRPSVVRLEHDLDGGTAVLSAYLGRHRDAFASRSQTLLEGLARYRPDWISFKDYHVVFRDADWRVRGGDVRGSGEN